MASAFQWGRRTSVIFRRPEAGLADGFGAADGAGGSALASELDGAELFVGELVACELGTGELGRTSTFTNVLCGSTLVEDSMLWGRVPSQAMNL
jgi:hypothetical protein